MELRALIEMVKSGDWQAFADLTRRYQDLAFGYAFSILRDFHLAQDVAQEAFAIAFFNVHKLEEPEAFPGWLKGVVRHQCGRILRRRHFELVPLEEAGQVMERTLGPDEHVEIEETRDGVAAAINALPQPQREVIALYYIKEYSQQEVAAFLDLPVSTVNNRLHAARKQLKRRMLAMVKDTLQEHALPDDFATQVGKIIEVRGPVIEAQFAADQLPGLLSALTVTDEERKVEITVQVVQQVGNGVVRCIAVTPSDELAPGMRVRPAGGRVDQALAPEALRRAVNTLGSGAGSQPEVLETGIKIVDLLCPYAKGGAAGIIGSIGVGKLVLIEEIAHNVARAGGGVALFTFVRPGSEVAVVQESVAEGYGRGSGAVQVIVLTAEDPLDPTPSTGALDTLTYMSLERAVSGLWPAVDPLRSTSKLLNPDVVGQEHYEVARAVRQLLQQYKELEDGIRNETVYALSPEDKIVRSRARKIQRFFTQPFFVAEQYTKRPGAYVTRAETVKAFRELLDGRYDELPEEAFMWRGTIDEVVGTARS